MFLEAIESAATDFRAAVKTSFTHSPFPEVEEHLALLRSCIDRLVGERAMFARRADAVRNCRAAVRLLVEGLFISLIGAPPTPPREAGVGLGAVVPAITLPERCTIGSVPRIEEHLRLLADLG